MTNADLMILAAPVIGIAVIAATVVGALFFFGYHRPVVRRVDKANELGNPVASPGLGRTPAVDGPASDSVYMRLTEAEAARLLAERAAHAQRIPEKLTT